jgi:hypothetical protein
MSKKIALVFVVLMSFSGLSSAGAVSATTGSSYDGSNDLIEAWGGTRNGGDC